MHATIHTYIYICIPVCVCILMLLVFLVIGPSKVIFFSLAILRNDCLSMHYAASAQQNRRLTLRDALKLSQHTGGVGQET